MKRRCYLFFHIVQGFIFMAVQSIKYNGSCPEIAFEDHFNCNDTIGNNSAIRCQFGTSKSFYLELSCDVRNDPDSVEFCAMPLISLQSTTKSSSIDFNYVIDYEEFCPRILENVKVLKHKVGQYLILYGCTNYDGEHEEGAWILGNRQNISDSLKCFNETLHFLRNSSAKLEDFQLFNNSNRNFTGTECGCNVEQPDNCEFFTQCKVNGGNDYFYYVYEEK